LIVPFRSCLTISSFLVETIPNNLRQKYPPLYGIDQSPIHHITKYHQMASIEFITQRLPKHGSHRQQKSRPVREGVSTDSLKFQPAPSCPTLLRPAGGPPPKGPYGRLGGGLRPSSSPLDTPSRTVLEKSTNRFFATLFKSFALVSNSNLFRSAIKTRS
jgi:hypothetical protein